MTTHIMIDLETLGTTADATILSIGAVRFDLETGTVYDHNSHTFYKSVTIDSQPARQISGDTIAWWMAQSTAAKTVFTEPKVSLWNALMDLREWVNTSPEFGHPNVWSNGADFDLPMLVHAYSQEKIILPWKPYAGRCYRTYKNLPGARDVKVIRVGEHHNALDDAIYQAEHVCKIHQALFMTAVAGQPIEVAA